MARGQPKVTERYRIGADEEIDNPTWSTWIYCVVEKAVFDEGPCKIGITGNLSKRFSSLQAGNWRPLAMAWAMLAPDKEMALRVEEWCLVQLRPCVFIPDDKIRLCSEWVEASPEGAKAEAFRIIKIRGLEVTEEGA